MNAEAIIKKLIEKNITIATAESCTGGMLGSLLPQFPGQAVFTDLDLLLTQMKPKTVFWVLKMKHFYHMVP